jgi:PII-like signaling protein
MIDPPAKLLMIFVDETDVWEELPLHEAIVRVLERHEIAGATVLTGIMGYGVHRRIHRKRLLGASDDRPVTIFVVDNEAKLRNVLPVIQPMVREGLLALVDAEVLG